MLNESQTVAVSHKEGPAIVLAGPGSGKTTVITHRIRNLIREAGVPPEKILVVTFTRAAAGHMKQRFADMMCEKTKGQSSYPVMFGTFHSVYYKILKSIYPYGADCIISEQQKADYIREIVVRLKIDSECTGDFIQSIAEEISKIKGNMIQIKAHRALSCEAEDFRSIYEAYNQGLHAEGKLDFDDILIQCYYLLKQRKDILERWQQTFDYYLIDEFQDINKVQYEIVKMLAFPHNHLFVVGDDDQSIYGFRGSCPEIMFQFEKDFPGHKKVYLETNYRSVPEIVSMSQKLIGHNQMRHPKKMHAAKEHMAKGEVSDEANPKSECSNSVDIRRFQNQWEELEYIAEQIKQYQKEGIREKEIAILVRNNSQIPQIQEYLQNREIKTGTVCGGRHRGQGMVAKDMVAYIKAALQLKECTLQENEALCYIINKPTRLISRQMLATEHMTLEQLQTIYADSKTVLHNLEKLQFDLKMIAGLKPLAALTYIYYGVGYEQYLHQYARDRRAEIQVLQSQFEQLKFASSKVHTLNEWIAIMEQPDKEHNTQGIGIMTIHRAKGLEFPVVFIPDANQGIIPSNGTIRSKDFEEERRVFYVAVTRAAAHLHISGVMEHLGCLAEMSMFVKECCE